MLDNSRQFCAKCLKKLNKSSFESSRSRHCIPCKKETSSKYYRKNRKIQLKKAKEYYKKHSEKIQEYRKNNRDKMREYVRNRFKTDPLFKLSIKLRNRLNDFIKNNGKKFGKRKTQKYLGCSIEELKIYLEKQFQPGMNWESHGKWHIDHIIPLSSAKTEEDLYKLCHYSNLQPLWAVDNLKKGAKCEKFSI